MADLEQSQAERDERVAQASMTLVASYADSIIKSVPSSVALKRSVLRDNIRTLVNALAEIDGNQNTCEFLEIQAIKRSNTPVQSPRAAQAGGAEIIQFSERYRKTGKANP